MVEGQSRNGRKYKFYKVLNQHYMEILKVRVLHRTGSIAYIS